MRYFCPGSTFIEPSPAPASTAKRVNNNTPADKDKGKRKINAAKRAHKMEQVLEAKKKEQMRKKATRPPPVINYVFVGNLEPTVTRDQLLRHFRSCGSMTKVEIRCSRGQAVNVQIPNGSITPRDRKYATIEFREPKEAQRALDKNGSFMGSQRTKLIVVDSAAELPEVAEIVNHRIDKMLGPKPVPRMVRMQRYLAQQATEQVIDPKSDKFRFWGYSFAKTVA